MQPQIQSLARKLAPDDGDDDYDGASCAIVSGSKAYILFDTACLTPGNIYHEVDHIVHRIMRDIGVVESEDSEEAYTYLGDFITNWFYSAIAGKVEINIS